jgi:cytochrome c biogenesis protein CcmG/thiol:disulfide interchange protein DsbE
MTRWIAALPLIAIVALAVFFAGYALHRNPQVVPEALVGKQMPDVTLPGFDTGTEVRLRVALKQGPVLVNFFASWCGPCQNETPQFDQVYRDRKTAGVRFVGLDVKDPSKSASQAWLQNKQITFPVIYDEPGKTALQLGDLPLAGLPATVVIDRQGRVSAVYVGPVLPKDLTNALDLLAKEA